MPKLPVRGAQPEEAGDDEADVLEDGFFEAPAPIPGTTEPRWAAGSEPSITQPVADRQRNPAVWDTDDDADEPPRRPRRPRSPVLKFLAVLAVTIAASGVALAYRAHHRREVVAQGLARARELLRPDTRAGYLQAARLLEPLTQLDPIEAASMRAFALAMLGADYRDEGASKAAEALLVEPERAAEIPVYAKLARAAIALGRGDGGTATRFALRARTDPMGAALLARVALLAGNLPATAEALDGAGREAHWAAPLALRGDVLRRRNDPEEARSAYAAALEISPAHPRAAYGMAKLALAGRVPSAAAMHALQRVLDDPAAPSNERARAALHLAALRARVGDRAGAAAAIGAAKVQPAARAWLERAAAHEELERAAYRVIGGAPRALQSASDDDPYEPSPPTPSQHNVERGAKPAVHAVAATHAKVTGKPSKWKKGKKQAAKAKKKKKKSKKTER